MNQEDTNSEQTDWINSRASQLANMETQQLLGYIAALLEVSIQSQNSHTNAILEKLYEGVTVLNSTPLDVNLTGAEDFAVVPVRLSDIENYLKLNVEVSNIQPVEVEVTNNTPIGVQVWG